MTLPLQAPTTTERIPADELRAATLTPLRWVAAPEVGPNAVRLGTESDGPGVAVLAPIGSGPLPEALGFTADLSAPGARPVAQVGNTTLARIL